MKKKKFLKKINQGIQSGEIVQLLEKKKKSMLPLWDKKENENNNIVESGRSMVEMLGVLAVIGVLSVGGIAGYMYAMNRYRANQVLNEVNLTSHLLASTLLKGKIQALTLEAPYGDGQMLNNPYSFEYGCADGECRENETAYYITIGNVPEAVCRQIVNSGSNFQYQIDFATGTEGDACVVGDNNILEWAFEVPGIGEGGETTSDTTDTDENCTGHGTWSGSFCNCNTGWAGDRCDIVADDSCSGHGWWCGSACMCNPGWVGNRCEIAADDSCNGHGTWCGNYCSCDFGWCGRFCEVSDCSGNGWWCGSYCICLDGWCGERCETAICGSDCSGHGTWCGSFCDCDPGWGHDECSVNEKDYCNNHGKFDETCGYWCECDPGWCGERCEISDCSGHGTWCGSFCDCDSGWAGDRCEINGRVTFCNDHGEAYGRMGDSFCGCNCESGWLGYYCQIHKTEYCNNHGSVRGSVGWESYADCDCDSGWAGDRCEINGIEYCNNHGAWCGHYCSCDSGWTGTRCEVATDESCNGHGTWLNGCGCMCDSGWYGSWCEYQD